MQTVRLKTVSSGLWIHLSDGGICTLFAYNQAKAEEQPQLLLASTLLVERRQAQTDRMTSDCFDSRTNTEPGNEFERMMLSAA